MKQLPKTEAKQVISQLEELRQLLNDSLQTGTIDSSVLSSLKELTQSNQALLTDLLPFFRLTDAHKKQVGLHMSAVKTYGHMDVIPLIQQIFPIAEHSFLVHYFSGKVQWVNLNLEKNELIAYPMINPLAVNFTTVMDYGNSFLFLDSNGQSYYLTKQDLLAAEEMQQKPLLKQGGKSVAFKDNQWLLKLEHHQCLAISKKGTLYRVNLTSLFNPVILETKQLDTPQPFLAICQLNTHLLFLGNEKGKVICIQCLPKKIRLRSTIPCLTTSVQKIMPLVGSNKLTRQLAVLGLNGEWAIINPDLSVQPGQTLEGTLFTGSSAAGNALFLNDLGQAYFLEENFNQWEINPYATQSDWWLTYIIGLDATHYLLQDVDNSFQLLRIQTLRHPQDLQQFNPYQKREVPYGQTN